jgi:hypothetical protein
MDDSSDENISMTDSMTHSSITLEKVKSIDISIDIPLDKLTNINKIINRIDAITKELHNIKMELYLLNK